MDKLLLLNGVPTENCCKNVVNAYSLRSDVKLLALQEARDETV